MKYGLLLLLLAVYLVVCGMDYNDELAQGRILCEAAQTGHPYWPDFCERP